MTIPDQHSTFTADSLGDVAKELSTRLSDLAMMAEVGDRFIFTDSLGTSTMEVRQTPDGGYILDVLTEPA